VYQIHSLESLLPIVEWLFVLLPILFHAILGVVIIRSGQANTSMYPYAANIRYTLQRATGIIAFAFILWHVFHMHGWFHFEAWNEHVVRPLHGYQFKPFNAASTLGLAMSNVVVLVLYAIGVLSCVYHLANGLWTMGITWGLWTSVGAQQRASQLCAGLGVALALLAAGVLYGVATVDIPAAKETEDRMYESMIESKEIRPNPEKRAEAAAESSVRGATWERPN
jgi:succinate dehydrogenase / fumarate reductase cytochrome b subunit